MYDLLHMQMSCHTYVINLLSREIVKRAGAVWDARKKVWFVHAGHDLRSVHEVLLHSFSIISTSKKYYYTAFRPLCSILTIL